MARKVTIERVLRDRDDAAGQSIRDWKIESESGNITIRLNHGDGFIMLRPDDIDPFVDDLRRAGDDAREMAAITFVKSLSNDKEKG